jgi:nitrate reductase assembly molybdenum cofactor insertion protein NarJ
MKSRQHYHTLAKLFEYPDSLFPQRVVDVRNHIAEDYPAAAELLDKFIDLLPADDLCMMQELFTRSFDVQAVTTLDLGYVLFGDDYKRGELLSNLNREHVAHQVDCGHELADHLPNVLNLMTKLDDEELLNELVAEIVAPSLHRMRGEFDDRRIEEKHKAYRKHYKTLIDDPSDSKNVATLYQYPLMALYQIMAADFGVVQRIQAATNTSDFLGSLNSENQIEENASAFY